MSEPYLSEIEARLETYRRRLNELEQQVRSLNQQLPRAWQQGGGGGGDGNGKIYWCLSDGAAVGSGTWPSLTPGTFTSDVYDGSGGSLVSVATGATVYWYYLDALATAGALVPCTKNVDGTYNGLLESCTAVD